MVIFVEQGQSGRDNNRSGPKGEPGDAGPPVTANFLTLSNIAEKMCACLT